MDSAKWKVSVIEARATICKDLGIEPHKVSTEVITGETSGEWVAYFYRTFGACALVYRKIYDKAGKVKMHWSVEYPLNEAGHFAEVTGGYKKCLQVWEFGFKVEQDLIQRVEAATRGSFRPGDDERPVKRKTEA